MNVLMLPLKEITDENIFFMDSKKNILMDGTFTKLIYMNEWFTMNGIYISLPIRVQKIEANHMTGQKHTIYFSVNDHQDLLEKIEHLEKSILDKYFPVITSSSTALYSLQHSLRMGFFKIFKESKTLSKNTGFALKISGIWENAKNYGLSYKIMDAVTIL